VVSAANGVAPIQRADHGVAPTTDSSGRQTGLVNRPGRRYWLRAAIRHGIVSVASEIAIAALSV